MTNTLAYYNYGGKEFYDTAPRLLNISFFFLLKREEVGLITFSTNPIVIVRLEILSKPKLDSSQKKKVFFPSLGMQSSI